MGMDVQVRIEWKIDPRQLRPARKKVKKNTLKLPSTFSISQVTKVIARKKSKSKLRPRKHQTQKGSERKEKLLVWGLWNINLENPFPKTQEARQ